jgi:hypothetical protein
MSTLKVSNIQATGETASRAVSGVAAAWCTFNGANTATIDISQNISSLTDNGTGLYRVNFTSNMSSSKHIDSFACRQSTGNSGSDIDNFVNYNRVSQSTGYTDLTTQGSGTNPVDVPRVCVATHGDLA